ncbi:hypothetical protein LMTR13_25175 [Bradyrhizobium icense]|uniref:Uncharacterized protein n=1 Tax=Bradyrhizobium icense TaxID=1274631 RepID=A0A1B1UJJ6_9BRAD|nr:hypothetical protein LMTR13_25175 [Bradyrhizobium icense]
MTSCSISRSSGRSASIFFRRVFSSSSCFSRFISEGISPAYFFFLLKYGLADARLATNLGHRRAVLTLLEDERPAPVPS